MSEFLSKQRKAAAKVPLTKQQTCWTGAFPKPGTDCTPAKALRNTLYIYPIGKSRGISKPE